MSKTKQVLFIVGGVALVTALIFVLTGCVSSPAPSASPRIVGVQASDGGRGYELEYVLLPDGRLLECLWHNRGSGTATMSCDWNEATN